MIKYSAPDGVDLKPAHLGDAGVDLAANELTIIGAGESRFITTGIRIEIPEGMFGWVVARSSTFDTFSLIVLPGIIDHGFTGEIGVKAFNPTRHDAYVEEGARVAQLVLMPCVLAHVELKHVPITEIHRTPTARGANGFGSTGRTTR